MQRAAMHNARLLPYLIAAGLLACGGGDPVSPAAPSLSVTISGLPSGTAGQVTVTGPGGYSQSLTTSGTLTPLAAGSYTVSAAAVLVGSASYSANPVSQTLNVGGSAAALVRYSTSSAGGSRLLVNINGLASGASAALTVTGPGGYSQTVTTTQTLTGLASGAYTIAAQDVTVGGTQYTASPGSQSVAVNATTATVATVAYGPPPGGVLNLRVDGMYLTQSAQTYDGSVPLVENRDGFLRVFVTANSANAARPAVRIRFYQDFVLQSEHTVSSAALTVPTAPDESSLSYSWNLPVPGALIRPGLSVVAEVDIANAVAESNEMDNAFPATAPRAMTVRAVPALNMTFVPVIQRGNGSRGVVSAATTAGFLDQANRMHPLDTYSALVHQAYTTVTSDTLQDDNTNQAWSTILGEIDALRVVENSSRYYYGVVKVSYPSGVAGVAYVSGSSQERAALGWDDLPSGASVLAHELAHNWGRNHAPCGGPSGVDGSYPHADGRTGVYGMDVAGLSLKPPTTSDIMGYCDPKWIGDYSYKAILNYLSPASPLVASAVVSQAVQPCLLIWGHIRNGEMVLEPAFQVNTRPSLPGRAGPYSVSAAGENGATLFSFSFAPKEIVDLPGGQKNFVFAVPVSEAQARQVTTIRLSGLGRQTVRRAQQPVVSGSPQGSAAKPLSANVRRLASGGTGVQWDARANPMVMVRDARTGEVLSLARGGSVQLPGSHHEVDLLLSSGVTSSARRVPVAP